MINFSPIDEGLFVGSAPQNDIDVTRLKQLQISAVICLQSDADFNNYRIDRQQLERSYADKDILFQSFPIQDFDEADLGDKLAEPVVMLHRLLSAGHRVYVHCNVGICRAPATVLGYYCHFRGWTIEQGLEFIRRNRPQANPYLSAVRRALLTLQENSN